MLIGLALAPVRGRAAQRTATGETAALVEEAGRPEVIFGAPARCDSLVGLLATGGDTRLRELLRLLDTPWVLQFEVIQRALERAGAPAREAVLRELAQTRDNSRRALLLVVFEKLGTAGDEKALEPFLQQSEPSLLVPALRCLAAFGGTDPVDSRLVSLLAHSSAEVRLAAAWALGRVLERGPLPADSAGCGELSAALRQLLNDPIPQVRFTAAETLRILQPGAEDIPEPLTAGP